MTAPAVESPPAPESPAPDAREAPSTVPVARRGRGAAFLLLSLFCAAGPAASAAYFWAKPKSAAEPEKAHAAAPATPAIPASDAPDDLIRAGSFAEALAACGSARPDLPAPQRRALSYREAVCLEALGRYDEAAAAYLASTPAEGDRGARARAELGRARCALAAGDLAAAKRLIDAVTLRSGHPDCAGGRVAEECAFLRARLAAARVGPARALDPLDPEALAWPVLDGGLDLYLDWLPPDTAPAASAGLPAGPDALAVRREADGFVVTAHLTERPVGDSLRAILAAAGLRLRGEVPPAALEEKAAIDAEAMPLDDLLAALPAPPGRAWRREGDEVALAPAAEAPAEPALRRATAAAPAHPRAAAARVWLANLALAAGRTREASKEYEAVLDQKPAPAEATHAAYNLGLVELRAGSLASARSRFVRIADSAPRSRWSDYGWWWAGRTHLDAGDPAAARKAFRSALQGGTREVASAVGLGVCACSMLEGDPDAARAALDAHRASPREAHRATWEAFDALLRHRAAPSEGRRERLVAALAEANDARPLGPAGALVAGRAYRELGLPDRMAALYDAATEGTRGPLAIRMTFEAAEWYELGGRAGDARQRYLAVAAADPKGLGPRADLKLAAMALGAGDADGCVRRCRGLLDRPGVGRGAVLALMGQGYEAKRHYRKAADCFGGRVPPE